MSIGLIIFLIFIIVFLLLLISIIGNIVEGFTNADNTPNYITNIGDEVIEIITSPVESFLYLIEIDSPFVYIGLIVIAMFVLYIILKRFFGKDDKNPKNSDYKIAKHGSHGSARWAKKNELFNDGTFVGIDQDKAYRKIISNMKKGE